MWKLYTWLNQQIFQSFIETVPFIMISGHLYNHDMFDFTPPKKISKFYFRNMLIVCIQGIAQIAFTVDVFLNKSSNNIFDFHSS